MSKLEMEVVLHVERLAGHVAGRLAGWASVGRIENGANAGEYGNAKNSVDKESEY